MNHNEEFRISIISESVEDNFEEKLAKALSSLDSNLMVSILTGREAADIETILTDSNLILIKSGSLRLEALEKKTFGKAIILINPEISSVLKNKLYLINNRVLIISCSDSGYFDISSTSFHDLISGSSMKIMHNCNEEKMSSRSESIARIVTKFLEESDL